MSGERAPGEWELDVQRIWQAVDETGHGSVAALCRASGLPEWGIYDWINKGRRPHADDLAAIAEASGHDMGWFMRRRA